MNCKRPDLAPRTAYNHYRCRCERCVEANRQRGQEARRKAKAKRAANGGGCAWAGTDREHTRRGYRAGCGCDGCLADHTAYCSQYAKDRRRGQPPQWRHEHNTVLGVNALPAQPLVELAERREVFRHDPALHARIRAAGERGYVSEQQADEMSVALGYLPHEVWGHAYMELT